MFGIKPMTAVYQRVADAVINSLDYVIAYIDDNIISGKTKLECIRNTITIVERFNSYIIKINTDNSKFCVKVLDLLGHVVSGLGVTMHDAKVKLMLKCELPKTAKQMQRFLGVVNFYRHFLPQLATVTAPLDKYRLVGLEAIVRN